MYEWIKMEAKDIVPAADLGDRVHVNYPEDLAVFRRRFDIYPEGTYVLKTSGNVLIGYAISHPSVFGRPPRLNEYLRDLPAKPDCIHIHDVVVAEGFRRKGLTRRVVALIEDDARCNSVGRLSLVAVGGTEPIWERMGFSIMMVNTAQDACESYSQGSVYMVKEIR